ncbi:EST gb/T44882 comes from this gene, partial [Arabidopsis thaliana]
YSLVLRLPLPPLSLTGSSPSGENLSQLKASHRDILVSNFVKDEAMKSLIWLTAEEAAKNRGKVLSLYRQLLRSINSPKLQLSYASRLAKKAEVRTIFLFGSEEISKHNVADLIRTGEYALSQLKQGKIPNNSTQY